MTRISSNRRYNNNYPTVADNLLITETPFGSKIGVQFQCCPSSISTIKSKQTLKIASLSVYLFSFINFTLGFLLMVKFFGFDLVPGCKDVSFK